VRAISMPRGFLFGYTQGARSCDLAGASASLCRRRDHQPFRRAAGSAADGVAASKRVNGGEIELSLQRSLRGSPTNPPPKPYMSAFADGGRGEGH